MRMNARCQNIVACPKVAGHKAAFLLLIYVDVNIGKSQPQILAKVFPKLHKLFTLNWLDGLISHSQHQGSRSILGKKSAKLEDMENGGGQKKVRRLPHF